MKRKAGPVVRVLRVVMPLVALACLVVLPPWAGIAAWLKPLPDTVQQQVDDAGAAGLEGLTVYVDRAGQPPRTYVAAGQHTDPHALFKIASISKLYIAAATVKLVDQGVLSLDDTVAQRLPQLAGRIANADRITVRMLLQHRSGIPNFVDAKGFDWGQRQHDPDDNLALVLDQPADFAPGAEQRYSNTNYLLLGKILDQALGHSHRRYIREHLLAPLGLTHTYGQLADVDPAALASGHDRSVPDDLKTLDFNTPGGAMIATAQDVGIFVRALNDGRLLTPRQHARYASVSDTSHDGWLPGYQSIARYDAGLDAVVVQFAGVTGGRGETELLAKVNVQRVLRLLRRQAQASASPKQ